MAKVSFLDMVNAGDKIHDLKKDAYRLKRARRRAVKWMKGLLGRATKEEFKEAVDTYGIDNIDDQIELMFQEAMDNLDVPDATDEDDFIRHYQPNCDVPKVESGLYNYVVPILIYGPMKKQFRCSHKTDQKMMRGRKGDYLASDGYEGWRVISPESIESDYVRVGREHEE